MSQWKEENNGVSVMCMDGSVTVLFPVEWGPITTLQYLSVMLRILYSVFVVYNVPSNDTEPVLDLPSLSITGPVGALAGVAVRAEAPQSVFKWLCRLVSRRS